MVEAIYAIRTAPTGIHPRALFDAKKSAHSFGIQPKKTANAAHTATSARPISVAMKERKLKIFW
jgi:ribosomal protein L25 (general stress protein Ctc)